MPDLQCFKSIYKIGGFAPRGAYFANIASNAAMGEDVGAVLELSQSNGEINIVTNTTNSTNSTNIITDSGNTY